MNGKPSDLTRRLEEENQELRAEVKALEGGLKDALGWKKYYEKDNERQHLYLESYGRRLNAIREAYYSEDVVPGIEEWIKKHDNPPTP